jgi:MEDS: MEthanogen/methylotroph, DcmR Sensory domain
MSSVLKYLDEAEPQGHFVHLYGEEDHLLVANVCRYLAEGLKRGDGIVVVAQPDHLESFTQGMSQEPGYARAVLEGRILFLDAQTTLNQILMNGDPNWHQFLITVGDSLREVQDRGQGYTGLRAYGEMVGILWRQEQYAAAARLEDFWNRLLESTGCSLFCAYPIDIFGKDFQVSTLDAVLSAHTHMLPVGDHLESALSRAMEEVLGNQVESIRQTMRPSFRRAWAEIPQAEGLVLWVRNNFRDRADEILARAREHYVAARV